MGIGWYWWTLAGIGLVLVGIRLVLVGIVCYSSLVLVVTGGHVWVQLGIGCAHQTGNSDISVGFA